MEFSETEIKRAYKIYSKLVGSGSLELAEVKEYIREEKIETLVNCFASSDDATVISAGEYLYIVPIAMTSCFHMNNETIKKIYLPNNTTNLDIYLMYVAIIVLLGEFYNSYQTQEPTRSFINMEEWLQAMNTRIEGLSQIGDETLKDMEQQQEYNWLRIIEKWMAIDDLKEKAKRQNGNTNSRLGFLCTVKNFLEKQEMVRDIGNEELELTEKSKIIVQRYYMDYEYNRGLIDFMYQCSNENAGYIEKNTSEEA